MIAGLAARAAATAGLAPGQITFTAVLSLARAAVTADTCGRVSGELVNASLRSRPELLVVFMPCAGAEAGC